MSYRPAPPPAQPPQSAALTPHLPDWAPQAKVDLSVRASPEVHADLTVTWPSVSKTWHFQLAGSGESAVLFQVGGPTVYPAAPGQGLPSLRGGDTRNVAREWQGGEDMERDGYATYRGGEAARVGGNIWPERESQGYYDIAEQYPAPGGGPAVLRYAAEEQWKPQHEGRSIGYDDMPDAELNRREGRVGGERMDRMSDGKGKSGKHKVHAGDRKRK